MNVKKSTSGFSICYDLDTGYKMGSFCDE
jgi:hypothetical protein